jgi:hypothetical protein
MLCVNALGHFFQIYSFIMCTTNGLDKYRSQNCVSQLTKTLKWNQHFLFPTNSFSRPPGLPDFSWYNIPKREIMPNYHNYTKNTTKILNGRKMLIMDIIGIYKQYQNFTFQGPQNYTQIRFFVLKLNHLATLSSTKYISRTYLLRVKCLIRKPTQESLLRLLNLQPQRQRCGRLEQSAFAWKNENNPKNALSYC